MYALISNQIRFHQVIQKSSIIVNDHVHAKQPGLDGRVFAYPYVGGILLFFICFSSMQKTLTLMVGIRYRDMPKLIKKQLARMKER
jgi:hypothetical protein